MFVDLVNKLGAANVGNEKSSSPINLSRRGFVGASSLFVIGVTLAGCAKTEEQVVIDPTPPTPAGPSPLTGLEGGDATPSLWIEIKQDGKVLVTCHRAEMGQQAWTSMTQIVMDELEAEWDSVEVVQALGDKKYGDQNTDGSRSVRYNLYRLRVAGAAMRSMLTQAAANHWKVDVSECYAEQGIVTHKPSKKTLSYGQLAEAAGNLQVPAEDEITLKTRDEWRYIGKEISSLTVEKITKGEGTFGQDVIRPDMLFAVIAYPPQNGSEVKSVDDSVTLASHGVLKTVKMPLPAAPVVFTPRGGIAVVAKDTWSAIQGRNALEIEWKDSPNVVFNSEGYLNLLADRVKSGGNVHRKRGNVSDVLSSSENVISADYKTEFLLHSPIEPPSATAEWTGDKLECWACVQDGQTTRNNLAGVLGVDVENIKVNTTWLGGAFGRKSKCEFVIEAAILAKEMGKPVKLVWTREDEVTQGYYHAGSAQHFEASVDENGRMEAYLHRVAFPSIGADFGLGVDHPGTFETSLGAMDVPYDIPNLQVEACKAEPYVRIGWMRSVSNIQQAFGVHSFTAELAAAAGRDQKEYMLDLIGSPRIVDIKADGNADYSNYGGDLEAYPVDTGRLINVLEKATDMAKWGRDLPQGHGLGLAVHRSFLTYVAAVIEVAVDDDGGLTIPGVWMSIDAGTVVNPLHVRAQTEGGFIFGLSNALYGKISFADGAVEQMNFPDWRVLRMDEAPREFEVDVVESNAPPAGVGEPATPVAAPALANAIFAATGKRFRNLPIIGPDDYVLPLNSNEDA